MAIMIQKHETKDHTIVLRITGAYMRIYCSCCGEKDIAYISQNKFGELFPLCQSCYTFQKA